MAGLLDRFRSALTAARVPAKPYTEQGVAGFSASGGYVWAPETNPEVVGPNRWRTAADILTNVSIVAASLRYSLNLISRPAWRADPPSDKQEAKDAAEFVEEVINGADTSWTRIIRRSAVYRYHGFNLQEWVAKKRDDGKIGIESVEPRPVHTITKWDLDENGGVLGVVQQSPQTGQEIYLPRAKLVYLVDDALTDRPEGLGWFRHLAEPSQRLKKYLKLETMGFERDMAGIPIGRAPLQRINDLVKEGRLTQKQADSMVTSLEKFVSMQSKEPTTGLTLDSEPFRVKTDTGEQISSVMQWGMELLTGSSTSAAALGEALHRLMMDMALIMGTDSLLIGGRGQGSRALSEDKSKNLYLTSNATLGDMAEAYDRDIVTPLWTMNGMPDELRPKLRCEDVSFKDAEGIAKALADMAAAGAILHPNDPAVNDLRDLMGISPAPEVDEATADLMLGAKAGLRPQSPDDGGPDGGGGSGPDGGGRPSRENPGGQGGKTPKGPKKGSGRAQKSDLATLYIHRPLLNPERFVAWAKANGFAKTLPPDDLHVTVAFSREPLDWSTVPDAQSGVTALGSGRAVERLGDKGAVVLLFECPDLSARWLQIRDLGASWDFPSYRPHVSITYEADPALDVSKIEPFDGLLEFGPEELGPVDDDWSSGVTEKAFNPDQPRDDHGRWTGGGGRSDAKVEAALGTKNNGWTESILPWRPDELKLDIRRFDGLRNSDKYASDQLLDPAKLEGSQITVQAGRVKELARNYDPGRVLVMSKGGHLVVADGHHRVTADLIMGRKTRARVIDVDAAERDLPKMEV